MGAGRGSSGENISQIIAHVSVACSGRGWEPHNILCPSIAVPQLPLRRVDSLSGN